MAFSPFQDAQGPLGYLAHNVNWVVTAAYYAWAAVAFISYIVQPSRALAFATFARVWREHVRG
jgi:hypothetical protein